MQAGAAGPALPDRRRSGALGGQRATQSARTWELANFQRHLQTGNEPIFHPMTEAPVTAQADA